MWPVILLSSLAGLTAAEYAWQPGKQYTYKMEARTAAGLHQVADQYSGVHVQGQLNVIVDSENQLTLKVKDAKYADFNLPISEGWTSTIPESSVTFKTFPMKTRHFQIHLNKGVVGNLVVEQGIPDWELNFIKGIASQFQVDTEARNLKVSPLNILSQGDDPSGMYSTMEESINGIYETHYEISVLTEKKPELPHIKHPQGEGEQYRIIKTRNFSNSDQHVVYRFGFDGHEGWEAGTDNMGSFLARSSVSAIVIYGKRNQYTVQSTETTEKVVVAPHLYNSQKGLVGSQMKITLEKLENFNGSSISMKNPIIVKSLVYEFGKGRSERVGAFNSLNVSEGGSLVPDQEVPPPCCGPPTIIFDPKTIQNYEGKIGHIGSKTAETQNQDHTKPHESSTSSSEDGSISSREELLPPRPSLNRTIGNEILPDSFFNHSDPQLVKDIVTVARHIGKFLNNSNEIQKNNILSLYTMLTHMTSSASSEQLQKVTDILYSEKYVKPSGKSKYTNYWSWQVFRDAVSQAGTGPALVTISSWIHLGKVSELEAAQLLAVLPRAARYPTTEYMNYFFELIKSDRVQNQKYLNDSGILSFTNLVRRSQVDRKTSRHRYPIHLAGAESRNHRALVAQRYIPYLQRQLENAIAEADSVKTQVYIRALSNTAHPQILAIYKPYLEGKQLISKFQRFMMVASLDKMAQVHPNRARPILYRIYQNQGEDPEIRVAAVRLLMRTNPSAQLLQQIAERTNYDHSKQVNAAVKSAIETAAKGGDYPNPGMINNAKAAVNLLTPENYGLQYSKNIFQSSAAPEHNLQHFLQFSSIQGLDGLYPDAIIYSLDRIAGDIIQEPYTVSYLSSGTENLIELLYKQWPHDYNEGRTHENTTASHERKNSKYTQGYISETLNYLLDEPFPIEGNFMFSRSGEDRFFAFDQQTIEQLPGLFRYVNRELEKGIDLHDTKFSNSYSIEVGFPLVTGVQFTYSLDEPTFTYLELKGHGHLKQEKRYTMQSWLPISIAFNGECSFVSSHQKSGKMGFVASFSNQRYMTVLEKNEQLYIPIKGNFHFNKGGHRNYFQSKLQPLSHSKDPQKIYQHITHAYTTYEDVNSLIPPAKGKNVKMLQTAPRKTYHKSFGLQETGYEFQIDVNTENNFRDMKKLLDDVYKGDRDIIWHLLNYDMGKSLLNDDIAISYVPNNRSAEARMLSYYETPVDVENYERGVIVTIREPIEIDNLAQPRFDFTRQEDLVNNVHSGIEEAQITLFDTGVSFFTRHEPFEISQYMLTLVYADSPLSKFSRYLIYFNQKLYDGYDNTTEYQAAGQLVVRKPKLPLVNYKAALNTDATMLIEGKVNFQGSENSVINFKGILQQTENRKQYLQNHLLSRVCEQQMKSGDYIQKECLNVTENANYLDKYDFSIEYRNVPKLVSESGEKLHDLIRYIFYDRTNETVEGVSKLDGQVEVGLQFDENLRKLNLTIETPSDLSNIIDVHVNEWAQPLLVQHPSYSQFTLLAHKLIYAEANPTCSLDANRVSTFNDRSYPASLGNCYHALAMTLPQQYHQQSSRDDPGNFAILVKDDEFQTKSVLVILSDDVITLEPSGNSEILVNVNGDNVPIPENEIAEWENGTTKLQAWALTNNKNVLMHLINQDIQLIYDGKRLKLTIPSYYRNKVRGLCGTFDGEQVNDFTVPGNCVVKHHKDFAASFAVADDSCKGNAAALHIHALKVPCYMKETVFIDVVSDVEAGRLEARSLPFASLFKPKHSCLESRVLIAEQGEKTCFSTKREIACSNHCQPTKSTQKSVNFICLDSDSVATRHWTKLINNGVYPDFSQKKPNYNITVSIPEKCLISYLNL